MQCYKCFICNSALYFMTLFNILFLLLLRRLKMVRSTLALTKRTAWSASTTTPKNTTTQQCSTKSIKRWGLYDGVLYESQQCIQPRKVVITALTTLNMNLKNFFSFQMLKCIELDEKLKSMDQEITVNPQFVQKVRQCLTASNT